MEPLWWAKPAVQIQRVASPKPCAAHKMVSFIVSILTASIILTNMLRSRRQPQETGSSNSFRPSSICDDIGMNDESGLVDVEWNPKVVRTKLPFNPSASDCASKQLLNTTTNVLNWGVLGLPEGATSKPTCIKTGTWLLFTALDRLFARSFKKRAPSSERIGEMGSFLAEVRVEEATVPWPEMGNVFAMFMSM